MLDGSELVIDFDHAKRELPLFLRNAGITVPDGPFPHENESRPIAPTRGYYDVKTANHVAAVCAWEIERFGYTMPGDE
jgi:hypothetical protein